MNDEAKQGGVISRRTLYAYTSKYSKEAIDCLYELMKNSNNDGIRLAAARSLLGKSLPDIERPSFYLVDKAMTSIPIIDSNIT